MNQEIRNKLRSVVTQCRKLLEDSVSQELEGKYGIFAKKDQVVADPNAVMTHLSEEERSARLELLDHFSHIKVRGLKSKEALDQLVREIAFTHLNRLCAYKMMEAREVYVGGQKFREAVSRGVNSNGVKFYLADHPEDERLFNTGNHEAAYRHFLDWLGRLLSDEIGVLFNPSDPANRLYPRQKVLNEVLELLNNGDIGRDDTEMREAWRRIWFQDETIGWVYQYFTPKELRDQSRNESDVPRNSYELAFRNQFFTPRYIVEFLTDNTLGRVWYEMRKGETKLKDQCQYMIRRPVEVFLEDTAQAEREPPEAPDDLSQEELLNLAVRIPHRPKKDPRALKILDPACGSGHFLLYCFDVLMTIYEEAYVDPELGPALRRDYPTLEELRRNVPRLILAHNLHGIDIDLRCAQIAALALWLRCQRAYREMGLKGDRPKITRSNFVCAEPMPGEVQMLKEFVSQLEPRLLGHIVEVVFEKMKLAGEAGSLLKIEEEIRDAVSAARTQWVREKTKARDSRGRELLFTEIELDRISGKTFQPSLFDLTDITDDQFFEQAESAVVDTLRLYLEKAQVGNYVQRRLFAEDAARGFAFVDLCRWSYDVVVMNPPFGSATKDTLAWFRDQYPEAAENLTVGEILQSFKRLSPGGMIGLIGDLPWLQQTTYVKFRSTLIQSRSLRFFVELGWGILGTDVEVALAVFTTQRAPVASFCSLVGVSDQETVLAKLFYNLERQRLRSVSDFLAIENHPFAYQISDSQLSAFKQGLRLSRSLFEAAGGVAASDANRVFRCWWEVDSNDIGRDKTWAFCQNGSPYSPFYYPTYFLIRADKATFEVIKSYPNARTPNSDRYWQAGLAYGKRTGEMYCYPMPAEQVITWEGQALFPLSNGIRWHALAIANSRAYSTLANLVAGQHKYAGYLNNICMNVKPLPDLSQFGKHIYDLIASIDRFNEISHSFDPNVVIKAVNASPSNWISENEKKENQIESEIANVDEIIGNATSGPPDCARRKPSGGSYFAAITDGAPSERTIFEILASVLLGYAFGRWDIRSALEEKLEDSAFDPYAALGACSPSMLCGENGLPVSETPDCYPLEISAHGILVDDVEHNEDIVGRVREAIELIWRDQAEAIEREICKGLSVRELREYFRKSSKDGFWSDHVSRYSKSRRKAPIYWLLQSAYRNYAIWLYYPRLNKDVLFKTLVTFVEPKLRLEVSRLEALRIEKVSAGEVGKEAKRLSKLIEWQEEFISELSEFRDKLRRAADLNFDPELSDGVLLNIAPLNNLVPWKEAAKYWRELCSGEYEWSSISKQMRQKGLVN